MCYYDVYRWECGDWKWGNFRQHCAREYRLGETCGIKLMFAGGTRRLNGDCQLCLNIQKKQRRLQKAEAELKYTTPDLHPRRQAAAQVNYEAIIELQNDIRRMEDLAIRRNKLGNYHPSEYRVDVTPEEQRQAPVQTKTPEFNDLRLGIEHLKSEDCLPRGQVSVSSTAETETGQALPRSTSSRNAWVSSVTTEQDAQQSVYTDDLFGSRGASSTTSIPSSGVKAASYRSSTSVEPRNPAKCHAWIPNHSRDTTLPLRTMHTNSGGPDAGLAICQDPAALTTNSDFVASKPLRHACDCCRKRKVTCDGEDPCGPCNKASIRCWYFGQPKNKGLSDLISARVLHTLRKINDTLSDRSGAPINALSAEHKAFGGWPWGQSSNTGRGVHCPEQLVQQQAYNAATNDKVVPDHPISATVDAWLDEHDISVTHEHPPKMSSNPSARAETLSPDDNEWLSESESDSRRPAAVSVETTSSPDSWSNIRSTDCKSTFEDSPHMQCSDNSIEKSGLHAVEETEASTKDKALRSSILACAHGHFSTTEKPRKLQLCNIEAKLNRLTSTMSGLSHELAIEHDSVPEHASGSPSWCSEQGESHGADTTSCSSAHSDLEPAVSSSGGCADGSDKSPNESIQTTAALPPCTINNQSALPGSVNKRPCGTDEQGQEDEPEDGNRKRPRRSPGPFDPQEEESLETQIPCFVDNCAGKDKHISEVIRNANKHHGFFVCVRCYLCFNTNEEYRHHCTFGDECEPHCISTQCNPCHGLYNAEAPQKRRHRRRMNPPCPAYKQVSKRDRWQFLYHLKYPDRPLPEPLFETGHTHPHGFVRSTHRPRQRQQSSRMKCLQQELAEVKSDLQAYQEQETSKDSSHRDRIRRLENIIAACTSLMSSVPPYLHNMIEHDAPDVFSRVESHQDIPRGYVCGTMIARADPSNAATHESTATHHNRHDFINSELPTLIETTDASQHTPEDIQDWDEDLFADLLDAEHLGQDLSFS